MTNQFVAGIVGAPFGLKGFVKVKSLSGETAHLARLRRAVLRKDGAERVLAVEECASAPGGALAMRFAGFAAPEEARKLSGSELLVSREDAAPLRPGEFYVEDLKGLAVLLGESADGIAEGAAFGAAIGAELGRIAAVIEGGGGDLAEIRLANGEARMVPFREEFLYGADLEKGHVLLRNAWILE
jgi:16S rRNA processing protein RimM